MNNKKQTLKKAFSDMAPRYEQVMEGELNRFWGWSYQSFVQHLIDHTEFQAGQNILDIATGTSIIPRKIVDNQLSGEANLIGLDITEAMLRQGKRLISREPYRSWIKLVCADAMVLPFKDDTFDVVVTGLSAHHLDVPVVLSEIKRVLKPDGLLSIIDVGMADFWKLPIIRPLTRIVTFLYFLFADSFTRAVAEARDMVNLKTPDDWEEELRSAGYSSIRITKLASKYNWIPEPLSIQSKISQEEQ